MSRERWEELVTYTLIGMVLGELLAAGIALFGKALGWWP